jgi:solute carrier family 25 phosphate transporter 3
MIGHLPNFVIPLL